MTISSFADYIILPLAINTYDKNTVTCLWLFTLLTLSVCSKQLKTSKLATIFSIA